MSAAPAKPPKQLTDQERAHAQDLLARARAAMQAVAGYDQAALDRMCRAVGWAGGNLVTATRLANLSVDESGLGGREPTRRAKVQGVLRDALRQKSVGIIEEIPEKGIVKYAKPAGVIASLVPVTSPYITPISTAIYALKCANAVVFSPHPSSRKTTAETVRIIRAALARIGAPEDLVQCAENPTIPLANEIMRVCDLTVATGGPAMVKAAYGSGKPAYGVGAGNATMVIDADADVAEAARNSAISKTNDHGSGCSADGNLVIAAGIYDAMLERLQAEGGYLVDASEKAKLEAAYWDAEGVRTADTIARSAATVAAKAGIALPPGKTFFVVEETRIGPKHNFSREKLGVVMAVFRFDGFDQALDLVRRIFETGGRGHSCGIYSFNDDHINRLALMAPVSRIMVRQVQSRANAGNFNNGMPMTSSMGCGIWGGNITNENISLKHYMNVTWVSRPIPEDRPSEAELFGEFYNTETF
jgi:sulfoacetaldehyde dehydrogenase